MDTFNNASNAIAAAYGQTEEGAAYYAKFIAREAAARVYIEQNGISVNESDMAVTLGFFEEPMLRTNGENQYIEEVLFAFKGGCVKFDGEYFTLADENGSPLGKRKSRADLEAAGLADKFAGYWAAYQSRIV